MLQPILCIPLIVYSICTVYVCVCARYTCSVVVVSVYAVCMLGMVKYVLIQCI